MRSCRTIENHLTMLDYDIMTVDAPMIRLHATHDCSSDNLTSQSSILVLVVLRTRQLITILFEPSLWILQGGLSFVILARTISFRVSVILRKREFVTSVLRVIVCLFHIRFLGVCVVLPRIGSLIAVLGSLWQFLLSLLFLLFISGVYMP